MLQARLQEVQWSPQAQELATVLVQVLAQEWALEQASGQVREPAQALVRGLALQLAQVQVQGLAV